MTEDLKQTYQIHAAKYAKGKMAVRCLPDGTGWKTLAARVISGMPGVRWSGRESTYICSPGRARKFEQEMATIHQQRNKRELAE
jgi:hypothetical protein